jgi:diguanylate cyclase (GGDEF)-like protein
MQNGLRGEDTVGRLGGDEFGVVAEIAEPRDTALEALFAHLKEAPDGFDPTFTVSVGTAVATDDDDVNSILQRADAAMYLAKRERKQDL